MKACFSSYLCHLKFSVNYYVIDYFQIFIETMVTIVNELIGIILINTVRKDVSD